jgi:peptidoglycan/LPS O-acetylase OafA/YrhL
MNTSALSSLRFVAAIIVVLFHHRSESDFLKMSPKIVTAGPEMVTIFMVLSGFDLFLVYYDRTRFRVVEYWLKRR